MLPPVDKTQPYTVVTLASATTLDWYRGIKLPAGVYELPGDFTVKIKSVLGRRQLAAGVVKIHVVKPGEAPVTVVAEAAPVTAAVVEVAKAEESPKVEEVVATDTEPVVIEDDEPEK